MKKPSHKLRPAYIILPIVLVVLGGLGALAYRHLHTESITAKTAGTQASVSKPDPQTHTEKSDGKTFPVPNNVPSSSIKDYTLITENENYMIQELNGAYKITLYAIINNAAESASYQQDLHDYKQAALQYLTQHGVNVNKASITYDPPEAAQD